MCLITSIISNRNGTEWSKIQGVIGWVIWNYELYYPWIVWHEFLLPINCVNNKMQETFKSMVEKMQSKSKDNICE